MKQTLEERISKLEEIVQRQQQQFDDLKKELKMFGSISFFS